MALPPGPPLPTAAQMLIWLRRPTELMRFCRARYGSTFTLSLPPDRVVFVSDPRDIRTIFTARPDQMHAGEANRIVRVLVGPNSVLLLDRDEHMRQRKLLLPSFHGERMRFYGKTMKDVTERVVSTWPKGKAFSLHPHTQHITLEVILRTVFGMEDGARLDELSEQLTRLLARGEKRLSLLFVSYISSHPEAETRPFWRYLLKDRDRTDAMLYRQIAERRRDSQTQKRKDVLAMLLEARDEEGNGMTDAELRDELMTALAAGHETTATALAWAVERILATPRVHEKLRSEVREASRAGLDPEKFAALPYLDATIKEVHRLRPVIPLVARKLKEPFTLGGHDLPIGTIVAPCIYLAQRDPAVYPEPEEFRPERFLDAQPDPFSWLPFGGGVRRCIGAAFALYEMKVVLGTIFAATDLELAQRAPARTKRRAITFWPEHGTRVVAKRVA